MDSNTEALCKLLIKLISEELSAVHSYTKALEEIGDTNKLFSERVKEIRADEEEHIKELSSIMYKI